MADFLATIGQQIPLSEAAQVKAGQSTASKMGTKHESFMKEVLRLIDSKEIDLNKPQSILKMEVYNALDEEWQSKVDRALINVCNLLSHIVAFRISKKTPDESTELQSMIEYLWQMKQRIEETHDVFKF